MASQSHDSDHGDTWDLLDDEPAAFPLDRIDETTVPDRLKCCISLEVMEDPATVVPCGHTFDHRCLSQLRGNQRKCPKCRRKIKCVQRLPDVRQLIRDTVRTHCIMEGCQAVMSLDSLVRHLRDECNYARYDI